MGSIPVAGAKKGIVTVVAMLFFLHRKGELNPSPKCKAFWIGFAFSAKAEGSLLTRG